jgi:hypothetical protein
VLRIVGDLVQLQNPTGGQVQQRGNGRLRRVHQPVDEQVHQGGRLVAQLGGGRIRADGTGTGCRPAGGQVRGQHERREGEGGDAGQHGGTHLIDGSH